MELANRKVLRAVLVSTLGRTPKTVTEVLGELLRRGIEIAEVYLIHTAGSEIPPDKVISEKKHIAWIPIEIPQKDILTEEGAKAAESTIFQTVYNLKNRPDVASLHLDLTGGRKTMSAYLMFAAQLFCDDDDKLWHVEPSEKFKASGQWYPKIAGDVNLLEIPFLRLNLLVKSIEDILGQSFSLDNPAKVLSRSVDVLEDLALLGLMARGIDHEANNDLNDVMRGLTKLEKALPDKSRIADDIDSIQAGLENIRGMISSFLAIGDSQKAQVNFAPVSVRHTIEEVYANLLMIYNLFDLEILGNDFQVKADRLLLKRVFRIILVNAHEASSKRLVVRLEQPYRKHGCEADLNRLGTIIITDDGVGMTDEQLTEAFAIFKTSKSIKGKGIGLAVARRLMLLHGGNISFQSQIGQGTTVKIQLPLSTAGVPNSVHCQGGGTDGS